MSIQFPLHQKILHHVICKSHDVIAPGLFNGSMGICITLYCISVKMNDIPLFKNKHTVRRGESCTTIPMIDGAVYLIKTEFIQKVILSQQRNLAFWNGRFRCVKNELDLLYIAYAVRRIVA